MSSYSALILAHGSLKAYYRLGEGSGTTLTDSGPNGLTGTYAGSGITYGVTGAIANDADTAVTFGAVDPATVPDNNALDLADLFSLECWVKRSATQGAQQTLLFKVSPAYALVFLAANTIALQKAGTGTVASSTAVITETANWHHIVATKNGAARKVYVDGADVTSLGTDSAFGDNTGTLRIGYQAAGVNRFPGSMDEIAIYGAVLTPEEVLQHYRTGVGRIVLTDSVASSESRGASPRGVRTDSVTASDSRTSAAGKAQADSVTPSDAVGKAPHPNLADSVTPSESVVKTPRPNLADSTTPTDSRTAAVGKTAADSVTPTDATARTPGKVLTDSASPTDSRASAVGQAQADTVTTSDALSAADILALGDSVTVTDQISPDLLEDFLRSFGDSVTVSDAVVLMASSASGTPPTPGGAVMVPVIRRVTVESHRLHFNDPVFLTDDLEADRRISDSQRKEELALALT